MANSPSARKRIRQTLRRTARHTARRSRARRFVRFCEQALTSQAPSTKDAKGKHKSATKGGDKKAALETASISLDEHFRRAMSELHRAAQKGALHRKAVSRKVSRLAKRMKAVMQADSSSSSKPGA